MNTEGTIRATQQQQMSMSGASATGRCSTPIFFLSVHNYESLFNFWILHINITKKRSI